MGFINVFVGSECSLKLKNNQLFLTKKDGGSVDIDIVVSSLVSAMKNKQSIIKLPNILNLKVHAYE